MYVLWCLSYHAFDFHCSIWLKCNAYWWCIIYWIKDLTFHGSRNLVGFILLLIPSCRYTAWIFVAALYHLPSFQSMGVDLRMNLSLFLTIFVSSILFLLVFHIIFLGLWYIGLVARVAGKRPEILTILQNCAVSFSFGFYFYFFYFLYLFFVF